MEVPSIINGSEIAVQSHCIQGHLVIELLKRAVFEWKSLSPDLKEKLNKHLDGLERMDSGVTE